MSGDDAFLTILRSGQPDNGVPTRVDIKSLEDAIPWLESLKKYVQDHLIPDTSGMTLSKNYGELYFGGSDSSQLIWDGKHNGYVKAVVESYRDIAHALGTVGHVSYLRRTRAGPFSLEQAISLDFLEEAAKARALTRTVVPLKAALDDIPALPVTSRQADMLRQGQRLAGFPAQPGLCMAMLEGTPVALVEAAADGLKVVRGFNL